MLFSNPRADEMKLIYFISAATINEISANLLFHSDKLHSDVYEPNLLYRKENCSVSKFTINANEASTIQVQAETLA